MNCREQWISQLYKIVNPVLKGFCEGTIQRDFPACFRPERKEFALLELLARTLCGISSWLELGEDHTSEGNLRGTVAQMGRIAIERLTRPGDICYGNFTDRHPSLTRPVSAQPLVDAAFLAQALLRAKTALWEPLSLSVKEQVITAMKQAAKIRSFRSNWLLFSAMIQAFLLETTGQCDMMHVDYALSQMDQWYKGDGIYGDGPLFAFDYYNSFVIHPMLLDVTPRVEREYTEDFIQAKGFTEKIKKRSQRYAVILERLIAPDGSYPIVGRSITYRCGAFHLLAQAALLDLLPEDLPPQQVRCALGAVITRSFSSCDTFDEKGFLRIGVAGEQPGLGEGYISEASLYLCTTAFLPLGLPDSHSFWSRPDCRWSSQKVWNGEQFLSDHAVS